MRDEIAADTKDHAAIVRLAKLLMSYGFNERALPVLSLAQWLAPDQGGISRLQVQALSKLGRWHEALDLMYSELSERTMLEEDHLCLANIFWAIGDREKGNAAFLRAFTSD